MLVKLNVGGTIYWTTQETLTSQGGMLSILVKHANPAQLVEGAYFIDRDPLTFRWILNYLRGSTILPKRSTPDLWLLREEADYFALDGLSTRIQHVLCPSFTKNDKIIVRNIKYTILSVSDAGYQVAKRGLVYNIPSSENVEPATIEKGDEVMAFHQSSGKRKPGLCMSIDGDSYAIQFDKQETPVKCHRSGCRF